MSRLIVVSGIPASGKSTVARILAQRSRFGVVVDGDAVVNGVVSGGVRMSPNASDEALRQLRLRYRAALAMAEVYLGGGFDVVFNENILGPVLAELPGLVPCDEFHLVVLNPDAETVLRRDRGRRKTAYRDNGRFTIDQLHSLLANETPRLGLWLDTTDQTPDETADAAPDGLDRARMRSTAQTARTAQPAAPT
ncbi:MAG TPA: AAA family ATPase [Actinocrinis sp.]